MKNKSVFTGDYLRELRSKKNWSQVELSEKTGIPQQSLSMYESGSRKPGLKAIKKLADKLGIQEKELLSYASKTRENRYEKYPVTPDENFLLCLFRQMNQENRKTLLKNAIDMV